MNQSPKQHRAKRRIKASERGSVAIMILAWTVLALFALGAIGYFHGLAALERIRTQARADAVALANRSL